MKKTEIHQFHSGSGYGDAVTNSMVLIRRMLRRFGFVSNIYVEHVAPELKGEIFYYKKLTIRKSDILLVHHSLGHDLGEWLVNLSCRKILVYHNITPQEFFQTKPVTRYYSGLGREQLKMFRPFMEAAIGASKLNADELLACGYQDVEEIPLLIDVDTLRSQPWDEALRLSCSQLYTILFVGRVSPNKCQGDLITIAGYLKSMLRRPFQLVLVGSYDEADEYYGSLVDKIEQEGVREEVRFTGKISDDALYGWYRAADLFLCMSEHEGFCVPLIEAMAFDVPVIAFKESNIPFTLGGAGILVTQKEPKAIAALIKILSEDRAMKRAIIESQRRRVSNFTEPHLASLFHTFLQNRGVRIPEPPRSVAGSDTRGRLSYQIEGPFETSYSLALVNREIAFALNRSCPGDVGLFPTEGGGDYTPDQAAIKAIPGLEAIWKKGCKCSRADVVIRNLYPPRVWDMDGQMNLLYFAWEESMIPFQWIDQFNAHLDGLPVLSDFIKKVLIDNGIFLPLIAAGCGVGHIRRQEGEGSATPMKKGFTFLHVSSCFPRKGVDVLLEAFAERFSADTDVRLIIKTFPNIHNTVHGQVSDLKKRFPGSPAIDIIDEDLSMAQMEALYKQCDALVAPSRGEGFGLPMAEAMGYGIPVITTAYGGQSDFCTEETSWLIDFSFQYAKTHMGLFDSVWMEPDVTHLGQLMEEVRHALPEQLQPRLDAAKKLIESDFTWDKCAERVIGLRRRILQKKPLASVKPKIGWVSSWNSKCGIATYSQFLLDRLEQEAFEIHILASTSKMILKPDGPHVMRCWTDQGGSLDTLMALLERGEFDVLVIQFNFAFFTPEHLERMIQYSVERDIVCIIFFHATADVDIPGFKVSLRPIAQTLAKVDRLLVHSLDDLNRLKRWGVYRNVTLFPHGVHHRTPLAPMRAGIAEARHLIASYGFMLPHKGLEQLIEAFILLRKTCPDLHLMMVNALYPDRVSKETEGRCRRIIETNGLNGSVTLVTEFLEEEDIFALLDPADLIVFPYQNTAESASGAVRYGLATGKPVACTPLDIFRDVQEVVHVLPGTSPEAIALGIEALLHSPDKLNSKRERQNQWLSSHSWDILGKRLGGMMKGCLENRGFKKDD